jgi:hypothetical protein
MVVIKDYDELRNHVLRLRNGAENQKKNAIDPAARSFANGLMHGYDQVFAALLAWEKSWEDNPER